MDHLWIIYGSSNPLPQGESKGPTAGAIPEAGLRVRTSVGLCDLCFSGGGGQRSGAGAEMGEGLTKTPSHMGNTWGKYGKILGKYWIFVGVCLQSNASLAREIGSLMDFDGILQQ